MKRHGFEVIGKYWWEMCYLVRHALVTYFRSVKLFQRQINDVSFITKYIFWCRWRSL